MTAKPALRPGSLYLGDNGRCFCGTLRCAGMSSYFTGRDISGQRVQRLTPRVLRTEPEAPMLHCEGCGAGPGPAEGGSR